MKRMFICIALVMTSTLYCSSAWAAGETWRDHAFPFNFLFGNHIDSHQQTRLGQDGDLDGFLYITFTGEVTPEGYPVAHHCDESTPAEQCVVGWILRGKPGQATFLYHNMDHPVWLVGSRNDIPQPGSYAHFNWITDQSTDPRAVTDPRCNAVTPHELQEGAVCPGYFLELMAVDRFAFHHEGDTILVDQGIDIATHVNIVASVAGDGGDARAKRGQ